MTRVVVVGDALLDRDWIGAAARLHPDSPAPVLDQIDERTRPGGAALAGLFARDHGADVTLVAATADDQAGRELRALLATEGVALVDLGLATATPEKVRGIAGGQLIARLDRGCTPIEAPGGWSRAAADAVAAADAILVADYGRGLTVRAELRAAVRAAGRTGVPVVWDPHPRSGPPAQGTTLATPNANEALVLAQAGLETAGFGPSARRLADALATSAGRAPTSLLDLSGALAAAWSCAVALTAADRGAVLATTEGMTHLVPVRPVPGDACGAGDCFAATATLALAGGASPSEAVTAAVHAARDYVSHGRRGNVVEVPEVDDAVALAATVRARGGTGAAAGGRFDTRHAGHLQVLRAARSLGDCLIVCLNGDASVRRLKGPSRPLNPAEDRAAVLEGLDCVDGVVVFDEDTPCEVLARIRPHIFTKGGDYEGRRLPEEDVLAGWGGRLVLLPFMEGRSTSHILRRAAAS